MIAAMLVALVPGTARGGDPIELAEEVQALGRKGQHAVAAQLAADGASDEQFDGASRVLLGGLARENFERAFQQSNDLDNLCRLSTVMRLVAGLDSGSSGEARRQMIAAAEAAESQLLAAKGDAWRGFCGPPTGTAPEPRPPQALKGPGMSRPTAVARTPTGSLQDRAPTLVAERRRRRAGAAVLGVGAVLLVPMAGVLVYRRAGEADLGELRVAAAGREETAKEQALAESLGQRYRASTVTAATLGATGTILIVSGAVLLVTGRARAARATVAPWGARGTAGLVFYGRF